MEKKGYSSRSWFGSVNHYDSHGKKVGHSSPGMFGSMNHLEVTLASKIRRLQNLYNRISVESGYREQVMDNTYMVNDLWNYSIGEFILCEGFPDHMQERERKTLFNSQKTIVILSANSVRIYCINFLI